MSLIKDIIARQVLDSRGNPTVEADVITENGILGRAIVPSGASTGKYEAVEIRDKNEKRYLGMSVISALDNIHNIILPELRGLCVKDQNLIDEKMIKLDGTNNKSNLGSNSILAVSLASAKAASFENNLHLFQNIGGLDSKKMPVPMMNILNGGVHADNSIDFQEFMIMPVGANTFSEALRMGTEVFHHLRKKLKLKNYSTNVGDEGGFAPNLSSNEEAIEIVLSSIESAGYLPGEDFYIAIDAAASEFYNSEKNVYDFHQSNGEILNPNEMISYWKEWVDKYPIYSIEDALDEDDWDGWKDLTDTIGHKVQLVGDDLFVTNVERLDRGIKNCIANSILIKVNQIGTLTETIRAVKLAQDNKYTTVMSHRSGETEDTTIADLSVALNTGQIKTGSLCRSDRVSKYNQLLRIEEFLGDKAVYQGKNILK